MKSCRYTVEALGIGRYVGLIRHNEAWAGHNHDDKFNRHHHRQPSQHLPADSLAHTMIGPDSLGARLAAGRGAKQFSQRELARRVGVSASLISQIENCRVQPSVATLMAIVGELDLSIEETLQTAAAVDPGLAPESGELSNPDQLSPERSTVVGSLLANDDGRGSVVQDGADRPQIELSSGVRWERLTVRSDSDVDFILVNYPPGAASSEGEQLLTHAGREYWYIISGTLSVRLVFEQYDAGPNDSFSFDCSLPHQFRNNGDVDVSAVVTIVRNGPMAR